MLYHRCCTLCTSSVSSFVNIHWRVWKTNLMLCMFHQCHFSSPESKARVSYCHSASSVGRTVHIFDFFSWTAWWILMKLDKDEVLKGPYKCCFSAKSIQGRIHGMVKIGHRDPPSAKNFFRPESYSNKLNAWLWFRSIWEEALLFLVPFRSLIFDAFLTSFWT